MRQKYLRYLKSLCMKMQEGDTKLKMYKVSPFWRKFMFFLVISWKYFLAHIWSWILLYFLHSTIKYRFTYIFKSLNLKNGIFTHLFNESRLISVGSGTYAVGLKIMPKLSYKDMVNFQKYIFLGKQEYTSLIDFEKG